MSSFFFFHARSIQDRQTSTSGAQGVNCKLQQCYLGKKLIGRPSAYINRSVAGSDALVSACRRRISALSRKERSKWVNNRVHGTMHHTNSSQVHYEYTGVTGSHRAFLPLWITSLSRYLTSLSTCVGTQY